MGIDDKLRSKNGTTVRYFLTDHLGSTEGLANASGAIVSSTSYDSFGNATSNIATTYRYTGREYDADTGLYYYRNRWYDPETGRFISEDPIGFAGGDVNLYGYVWNNPQNFVDPFGHFPDCPLGFGGFGGSGRFNGGPSSGWWDAVQLALGAAGMIPGFGEPFDLADAGISYLRGDYIGASLSMAAAIPGIGNVAGASKIARTANRLAKGASRAPNPGGRLGKPSTRQHIDDVATEMEKRGWTITGGGNRLPEEYLSGPGGGRKGSSFPDITATKNGRTLRINTVDTRAGGIIPTTREARNAARIRSQTPGDHLLLIPKP